MTEPGAAAGSPVRATALGALYRPARVAVVGASEVPGKWGTLIVDHILSGGYEGQTYLVNPRYSQIRSQTAYASVADLPDPVDLVVVGVAADRVPSVLADCAINGCGMAVIVTSGFADEGPDGQERQAELLSAARRHGVRVVGPNCLGLYSAAPRLYASIGLSIGPPGGVALVSQSGNVGIATFRQGVRHGLGLHSFLGLGNQADVAFADVIDYLADDESCTVVALYAEGVTDGRAFFDAVERCSGRKPVVALKGGRARSGLAAVASHTGSLATDGRVFEGLLRQAGGTPVRTLEDLVTTASVMAQPPRRRATRRAAVLTDGGGFAVLAVDGCDTAGLALAPVSAMTEDALRKILPGYCTVGNPTDVGGAADADPSVFGACAEVLLEDRDVDSLIISGVLGGYSQTFGPQSEPAEQEAVERIVDASRRTGKAVIVHSTYDCADSAPLRILARGGIPVVSSLDQGLSGLAALDRYRGWRDADRPAAGERASAAPHGRYSGDPPIDEPGLYGQLRELGADVPDFRVVSDLLAARGAALAIGYPVVMKAVLPAAAHKSELGAVVLDVADEAAVTAAFERLRDLSREVLVVRQVSGVLDVLVGATRTARFGAVVTIGSGGLLTEVRNDVGYLRLPLAAADAARAIAEHPVLGPAGRSTRRGRPLAVHRLVALVETVAQLVTDDPLLSDVEFNPVILDEDYAWVVDAKVRRAGVQPAARLTIDRSIG